MELLFAFSLQPSSKSPCINHVHRYSDFRSSFIQSVVEKRGIEPHRRFTILDYDHLPRLAIADTPPTSLLQI